MLAQVQTTHSGSSLLRQLASAMAQPEKTSRHAEQHTTDLKSLPPKLQTLLASLSEDLPPATPDQQAKLATFSARICVRLRRSLRHSRPPNKFLLG
jgi:flagellar hook-length control protein FliK